MGGHLKVPDGLLLATGQSEEEFAEEARFLLALKLFEVGRLSAARPDESLRRWPRTSRRNPPAPALGS